MTANSNASGTQRGFHYQDFCALYYFVDNIKNVKKINDEGKEDFDVLYNDNKVGYFQVKEVYNNVNLTGSTINDCLRVLLDDYNYEKNKSNIKELGIITNTKLPFGKATDNSFEESYMHYDYSDLSQREKDVINKQAFSYNIDTKNLKLLDSLTVTRIKYQGSDDKSKHIELRKITEDLLHEASIYSGNVHGMIVEWKNMFTHITENSNYSVSKSQFIGHTEMVALDIPNFDNFFDTFDEDVNEAYVISEYHNTLEKVCFKFEIKSKIESEFFLFKMKNTDKTKKERIKLFSEKFSKELADLVGLTYSDEDLCISKLIIWLIVKQKNLCQSIEKRFNL